MVTTSEAMISETLRPASAVSQSAAFTSLLGALAVLAFFKWQGSQNGALCLVAVVIFIALPHVGLELASWQKTAVRTNPWQRFAVKLWGQLGLIATLALAYFVFQGFFQSFLLPLVDLGRVLFWVVIVATPIYLWVTDRRMEQPEDGLYQFGLCLLGRFKEVDSTVVQQYLLSWTVKGFFGPLMAGFALNDMHWFLEFPLTGGLTGTSNIYEALYKMIYFIDVIFAVAGYLFTFRLLRTQIRSTEPTMFGWVVCLLCYPPFWQVFSQNFMQYEDGFYWGDWLRNSPSLWLVWSVLIVFCILVYVWATISFGIRFSNLTNRGTLTNGPYRWMKHPAYVSKNISWWLIAIPFLSNGGVATGVRDCIALSLVNGVYYLRAKTEERHMLRDPDYVAYWTWMETNSLYAKIKSLIRP